MIRGFDQWLRRWRMLRIWRVSYNSLDILFCYCVGSRKQVFFMRYRREIRAFFEAGILILENTRFGNTRFAAFDLVVGNTG